MLDWLKKRFGHRDQTPAGVPPHLASLFRYAATDSIDGATSYAQAIGVAAVAACVRVISQAVAMLPVELYRKRRDGTKVAERAGRNRALLQLLKSDPAPWLSGLDFRQATTATLVLYGNALIQVRRNAAGDPVQLVLIDPSLIDYNCFNQPHYGKDGEPNVEYRLIGQSEPLSPDEVIHLKGLTFNGLCGISMTRIGANAISIARALDLNALKYFRNSSRPGLIWEYPDNVKMTDAQYDRVMRSIESSYGGTSNAYRPIIAEAGVKVKQAFFTNTDSQLDQSRTTQALEICRLFGVPPARLGILSAQLRGSVEDENRAFVTQTLGYYCAVWAAALDKGLLTAQQRARGLCFEISTRQMQLGSMADRAQAYRLVAETGAITKNEIRRDVLGLEPVEGGDEFVMMPNMAVQQSGGEGENEEEQGDGAS